MEWLKDTAKSATHYVSDSKPVQDPSGAASAAYEIAKEMPRNVYNTASDYTPGNGSTTSASSVVNSPPFNSFKPPHSMVWKGYFIYGSLAMGCALPWWTFVVAADYFLHLYPASHIIRWFGLAYYLPWLLVYVVFAKFFREGTSWVKINVGLCIAVLALVAVAILNGVFIKGERGTTATFLVTLAAVGVAGCADAVGQGSLLGVTVELLESFKHAYVTGATVAGVLMMIVRVITKASLNSSASGLRIGSIIHLSVAAFILVLVISLFAFVHSMPEMDYYNSINLGSFETVRLLIQDEDSVSPEIAASAAIAAVAAGRASPARPVSWLPVLNRMKLLAVALAITPIVSLAIFPGYLAEDLQSAFFGSWYPVLLIGTYAISDLAGGLMTAFSVPERNSSVFAAAVGRVLLVALFVLALVGPSVSRPDVVVLLLTALLGFSNGYVLAALIILIPKSNPASDAESAGIIFSLIRNAGSIVGAGLSWIWIAIH